MSIINNRFKAVLEQMENIKPSKFRNDKVLIVDGLNTYIRAFSVSPTLNDNGDHIGGTLGFFRSIGAAIKMHNPSRVVVVFDGKGGSKKRKGIYEGYKGNRVSTTRLNRYANFESPEKEAEAMRYQLSRVGHYLKCLPVDILTLDNVEADDVIAYCTKVYFKNEVVILSTDKDFLQLINERVTVYRPMKKALTNPRTFQEEFGINAKNYHILKMFLGDASDNIIGIPGIGPKTVLKLYPELLEDRHIGLAELKTITESKMIGQDVKLHPKYQLILSKWELMKQNNELMNLHIETLPDNLKVKVMDMLGQPLTQPDIYNLNRFSQEDSIHFGTSPMLWYQTIFARLVTYKEEA
jgi:5'-3' exonuclease